MFSSSLTIPQMYATDCTYRVVITTKRTKTMCSSVYRKIIVTVVSARYKPYRPVNKSLLFNRATTISIHLWGENNQQKRRFLCEKLQDFRVKQKKRNTTPRMRYVAAKIVTAQLQDWHIFIGLSQFAAYWLVLKIYVFVDNSFSF